MSMEVRERNNSPHHGRISICSTYFAGHASLLAEGLHFAAEFRWHERLWSIRYCIEFECHWSRSSSFRTHQCQRWSKIQMQHQRLETLHHFRNKLPQRNYHLHTQKSMHRQSTPSLLHRDWELIHIEKLMPPRRWGLVAGRFVFDQRWRLVERIWYLLWNSAKEKISYNAFQVNIEYRVKLTMVCHFRSRRCKATPTLCRNTTRRLRRRPSIDLTWLSIYMPLLLFTTVIRLTTCARPLPSMVTRPLRVRRRAWSWWWWWDANWS